MQKSSTIGFRLGSKYDFWQYCQKHISEKRVADRNKRLRLWSRFINYGIKPVLDSCWLNHWKWLASDAICGSLIFCSLAAHPNWVKYMWPGQIQKKYSTRVNFDLPKVGKITIFLKLLKVSKMTSRKIYISPVMEKSEISNLDSR